MQMGGSGSAERDSGTAIAQAPGELGGSKGSMAQPGGAQGGSSPSAGAGEAAAAPRLRELDDAVLARLLRAGRGATSLGQLREGAELDGAPAKRLGTAAKKRARAKKKAAAAAAGAASEAAEGAEGAGGGADVAGISAGATGGADASQLVSTALPQDRLIPHPQGQIACLIEARYQELLASQRGDEGVSITAFAAFIKILSEVRQMIQERHTSVTRKHKLVAAQLARSGGGRSTDKYFAEMNKLEAQHESLQRDQAHYNSTIDMLKKSPAYQKLLDLGEQLMTTTRHGEMVLKSDLEVEEEVSFEDLLGQMKMEDEQAKSCSAARA